MANPPPASSAVITKKGLFDAVGYCPHEGQIEIHRNRARHRVCSCGRRFGKSQVGGHELVPEAFTTYYLANELLEARKRREFWIVGPQYSDSEKEFRVVYDAMSKLQLPFDKPGTYNDPHGGDMVISLWRGRFMIIARSAAKEGTLVGEGLSGAIMAEAAKMKPRVWTKYIRPALADFKGWSLHTSTPEGKNHFHELWQRGQDPSKRDWASFRRPSYMNPYVFPRGATEEGIEALRKLIDEGQDVDEAVFEMLGVDDEIAAMMMDMSEEKFNQEVLAEFTDYVGRVFKQFDEEIHVTDIPYDPALPLYVASDYGYSNPFVLLFIQVDVWDNVKVVAEYYRTNRDTSEVIQDIKDDSRLYALARNATAIYPEPADPGTTNQLSNEFKWKVMGGTGGELKDRIELIRKALKTGPKHIPVDQQRPMVRWDRKCVDSIREMQDYRYPERKSEQHNEKERPLDKDDHSPEALGRFFVGHFGKPVSSGNSNRAKVKQARIARR